MPIVRSSPRFMIASSRWALLLTTGLLVLIGCGPDGAPNARRIIREKHAAEIKTIIVDDIQRHLKGSQLAAQRLVPGFAVADPTAREAQVRTALRLLTKPPKGISELVASARTFTAAVATDGVVIATDAKDENDRMTGVNLGKHFQVVRDVLRGKTNYGIEQFPSIKEGVEGNVSLLFAAPARKQEQVVGATLTGIPLWRLAQRFSKQMQVDHFSERGAIFWVYVYRADKLHYFGTPSSLDEVMPDAAARKAGLAKSPGGFTGELLQFGRWFAYGVLPLRVLGPDTGVIIVRSDPV